MSLETLESGFRDAIGGTFKDADEGSRQVIVEFPHEQLDTYNTDFSRDCFRASFEKHLPVMCWQHDKRDPIGRGLRAQVLDKHNEVVGQFSDFDAVPNAKRAFSQIADGTITDFSFFFENGRSVKHPSSRFGRRFTQADMVEFSPVTVGSIPGAKATGLRADEEITMPTIEEILALDKSGLVDGDGIRSMLSEHYPNLREHLTVTTATEEEEDLTGDRAMTMTIGADGAVSTEDDTDGDVNDLISAIDAALDQADVLVDGVDPTTLPAEVQQALALTTAAGAAVDQLMVIRGIPDVEDDSSRSDDAENGEDGERSPEEIAADEKLAADLAETEAILARRA